MLAHYRVDVLDPRISLRRVRALLRRLPPGAWPDQSAPGSWSNDTYLLAAVLDAVRELTWVTLRANGARNAKPPRPVPRPGGAGAGPSTARTGPPSGKPNKPDLTQRVKTGSWADFGRMLTGGLPGVRVHGG